MTETDIKRLSPLSSATLSQACNGSMPGLDRGSEVRTLSVISGIRDAASLFAARYERKLPSPVETLA